MSKHKEPFYFFWGTKNRHLKIHPVAVGRTAVADRKLPDRHKKEELSLDI
jgi:hypothetical protein